MCAICSKPTDKENDTSEHIIPNAIGGRKKIRGFICRTCNSETGDKWDSELCGQLSHFSLLLQIKRDRGEVPHQIFNTADGRKIRHLPDGSFEHIKPTIDVVEQEFGAKVHILARNEKEAKQIIKGQIKSLNKKYPNAKTMDISNQSLHSERGYLDSPILIDQSYGGLLAGKSIVKSTLAMVADKGIDTSFCEHANSFLREDSEPCFGFYYDKLDSVVNRPVGIPLHCVHVEGDNDSKLVKGYVEYFGHVRYVLLLSSTYQGPSFSNTYSVNPMTGEEIELQVNIELSEQEFADSYEYKKYDTEVLIEAIKEIMTTVVKYDFNRQLKKEIDLAMLYAFKKLDVNNVSELSSDRLELFDGYIMESLLPFCLRNLEKFKR